MRYKILITILSLSLSLLLLSSCTGKPETTPESVLPGEESGTLSPTGDETGEPDPAGEPESGTEPESETEPAAAKDRMKKLVREESELLQAELQAEKETDPLWSFPSPAGRICALWQPEITPNTRISIRCSIRFSEKRSRAESEVLIRLITIGSAKRISYIPSNTSATGA